MLFTSQPLPRGPINQYRRVPSRCIYIALYILIDVCINNAGPSFSLKCYAKMQTFSFSTMVLVIRMSWEELWRDKLQTCQASVHVFCFKSVSWRPPLAVGTPLFRLAPALGEAGLLLCLGWSTEGPLGPDWPSAGTDWPSWQSLPCVLCHVWLFTASLPGPQTSALTFLSESGHQE